MEQDNYVAWCRYTGTGEKLRIVTCDSTDEGAFKVWREPARSGKSGSEDGYVCDFLKDFKELGNLHSDMRRMALTFIDKTPNLPDNIKPLAREYIAQHINQLCHYMGTIELTWRRTMEHHDT